MDHLACQVCLQPLNSAADMGTNADGTPQPGYCSNCFKKGKIDFGTSIVPLWLYKRILVFMALHHMGWTKQKAMEEVSKVPHLIYWRYRTKKFFPENPRKK